MGSALVLDVKANVITGFAVGVGGGVFLTTHIVFLLAWYTLCPVNDLPEALRLVNDLPEATLLLPLWCDESSSDGGDL